MVGSGIFILPALAYRIAGTTVVLAFIIAAVLVVPAAASKAEMATAMPEDGGTYIYVERGMGPLIGTIAGVGTWFSLSFKGALALVGGVPYLIYVAGGGLPYSIKVIAIAVALVLIVLNLVGSDVTGRFQVGIVAIMLAILVLFITIGIPQTEGFRVEGAFDPRAGGTLSVFEAAGAVFVSYAGVTKVASVAEEIENPSRNIPLGIFISLIFTAILYVLVVVVTIGVVEAPSGTLGTIDIPGAEDAVVAEAANNILGWPGVIAITVAAMFALISTANAGILSASRYPFAMARDDLVPSQFTDISERFGTPSKAVMLTGAIIMLMIAFVPILQIAKLASAFQILVFVLVNLALIGFREGAVDDYDPDFISPLYPWLQVFGIVAGLALLTTMGTIPIVGAIVITAGSMAWYYVYARKRIGREGAARSGIRQEVSATALDRTRELFESTREYDVLVGLTERTSDRAKRDMVRMAADLGRLRTTVVTVAEFLDVPHRMFHEDHAEVYDLDEPEWIRDKSGDRPEWLPDGAFRPPKRTSGGVQIDAERTDDRPTTKVEHREIDSEDHKEAIVDYATYDGYDLLVLERDRTQLHERIFGNETDWLLKNAPCDVMLVEDRGFDGADEIAVVAARGAYDPIKLLIADAVAEETGASIHLIQALGEDAPESQREDVEQYHQELISICTVEARSSVIETDDRVAGLARFVGDADLLVTGVDSSGLRSRLFGSPSNQLVESVECAAVMVQGHDSTRAQGLLGRVLMNYVFR